jgi:PAS domain S-box-containing protein
MKKISGKLLLLLFALGPVASWGTPAPAPVIQGVADLRQFDFARGVAELKGQWRFHWHEFIVTPEKENPVTVKNFIEAPRSWTGLTLNSQPLPALGFATYSVRILLPQGHIPLALSMFEQGTAVKVWANGMLVGERGIAGVDAGSSLPDTRPLLISLPKTGSELRLDLQISNHNYRKGGMWNAVKIGHDGEIRRGMLQRQWLEVFAAGCLLIMFFYHLGVHVYYRREKGSLIFAVFCFALFLRLASTSVRILPEYIPQMPFWIYSRLEYISWFFSVPLGIHYIQNVFSNLRFRWLVSAGYAGAGLFSLSLFFPATIYSHTVLPSNILFFLFMLWSLFDLARLLRSGSPGVGLFLSGAFVLAVFTLNDILFNLEILRIGQLGPFGMVVFILCQAIVTSRRSMSVYAEKETLQVELNEKLQEVLRLRTRELQNARVQSQLSQQQLTNVINNIPGITYRCAPEYPWTMFFMSHEAENITGYPVSDFLNDTVRTFASVIIPEDLESVIEQDLPGTPDRYRQSYRIVTKAGATVWLEDRGQRIYDEVGELLWLDGVMIDITALKQIELELMDALGRAEAANLAKSQFLATMSHELRTPLHGILGMTSVLKNAGLNREQVDLVGIIEDSGHALLRSINDILDLAKVESGKMELENIEFNVRQLCEDLIPIIKVQARAKPLDIGLAVAESVNAPVMGDPTRLRQVLVNLLGNAVKFTEKGSIVLEVKSRDEKEGWSLYTFRVHDSGIGIDEKNLEMIFEPFRQADQSTTRRFGGTGLGLTISQQIVQTMAGKISVASTPGEGTIFTVELSFRKVG